MPRMRLEVGYRFDGGKGSSSWHDYLFHWQHQIHRVIGHDFKTAVRVHPHRIFQAHAQAPVGVVQPRLDGEHCPGHQPVGLARAHARPRALVDVQPHAMTQAVDIAILRFGVGFHRRVAQPFEQLAGALLVGLVRGVHFQLAGDLVIDREHILVQLSGLIGGIPQAPGAGEIVEVPAAFFAGIDIEHDRLPQPQEIGGVAGAVRHAGIAPDGENSALRDFQRPVRPATG